LLSVYSYKSSLVFYYLENDASYGAKLLAASCSKLL